MRLRRSDPSAPGYGRRRRGKSFSDADADGRPLTDPATVARNEATYGVTTLRPEHLRIRPTGRRTPAGRRSDKLRAMEFRYPAKGGIERVCSVVDDDVCRVLIQLRRRRPPVSGTGRGGSGGRYAATTSTRTSRTPAGST